MSEAVRTWSGANVKIDSGSEVALTIRYNKNLALEGDNSPYAIAVTKTPVSINNGHMYKREIVLGILFFRNGSDVISMSTKNYAMAHELAHVFGMGHSSGLMGEYSGNASSTSISAPQRYGMMLLNHTHNCTNYSYDQHYLSLNAANYHKKRCTQCKSFSIVSHSAPSSHSYDSTHHWSICACGYKFTARTVHTMKYTWKSSTTHLAECTNSKCGLEYNQSHTMYYVNQGASGHLKYCRLCSSASSHATTEVHDIIYSGGIWKCSRCTYNESGYNEKRKIENIQMQ